MEYFCNNNFSYIARNIIYTLKMGFKFVLFCFYFVFIVSFQVLIESFEIGICDKFVLKKNEKQNENVILTILDP